MNRTPLFDVHRKMGANFKEFYGWEVPASYGDELSEYKQVRTSAAMIDLSFRGKLRLTGSERSNFLNGVVTNDVAKLQAGQGCYALMLNQKGRIVADMIVYAFPEHFLIDVAPQLTNKVKESLEKYLISEDVQIEALKDIGHISVQGKASRELIEKGMGKDVSALGEYGHREFDWLGGKAEVFNVGHTGEAGYDLMSTDAVTTWTAFMEKAGVKSLGVNALNTLRIEAGILWYGEDMDENTIALEVPLVEKAISYTKGCYAGQETVARVTYQGRVNKKLVGIRVRGMQPPRKGEKIIAAEKEVGFVCSSCFSPTLGGPLALGYVHRDHTDLGTQLEIEGAGAEVVQLPVRR